MTPSVFVGLTAWSGLLAIIFGVLFEVFDNNFTTWLFFVFLCLIGFFAWIIAWSRSGR